MEELLRASLAELRAGLLKRSVSAVELCTAVLERIERTHETLNAVVGVRAADAVLAEARSADERYQRGDARPLEGIPLGVKDLEDAAGLPTTHGARPLQGAIAAHDSIQVERLRAAGAIVVGKTTAPEFGHTGLTKSLLHGVTRSPWDLERTPGGSSGGSAAALAGGVLPLVTASDGGGSVRIPASFTGAFGLKPTHGRIPHGPAALWEYDATAVNGPLTRTVGDAAFFLDLVAGHDARDPASLPRAERRYADAIEQPLPSPLRIAFSPDLGYAVVQEDVAAVVASAVQVFADLGHRVEPLPEDPPEMLAQWGLLSAHHLGATILPLLAEHEAELPRAIVQTVRMAGGMGLDWWREVAVGRARLVAWCARVFAAYDLLLTPTVSYDPPPAKGPFPAETAGRPQPIASVGAFTIPFNLSWSPAASVRAGLSRAGLPVGLEIVGPLHRDDLVLQAARAFERERPWHPRWPGAAVSAG